MFQYHGKHFLSGAFITTIHDGLDRLPEINIALIRKTPQPVEQLANNGGVALCGRPRFYSALCKKVAESLANNIIVIIFVVSKNNRT